MPRRIAPRSALAVVVTMGVVHPGATWTTISQMRQDETSRTLDQIKASHGAIHRLWNYPTPTQWPYERWDSNAPKRQLETGGLEGGITFAWDPAMCAVLNPLFGADLWGFEFSSCADIAASVRLAFDSWSANHPRLKFQDVSNECMALSAANVPSYTNLNETTPCPLAEIWITTTSAEAQDDAAAVTIPTYNYTTRPRHTNGRWMTHATHTTVRATVGFKRDNICWYLDATFCNHFHQWKRAIGTNTLLILGRCIIFGIWGLMLADVIWLFISYCRLGSEVYQKGKQPSLTKDQQKIERVHARNEDDDLKTPRGPEKESKLQQKFQDDVQRLIESLDTIEEWQALFERISRINFAPWIMRLFLLIGPILFYQQIFDPCFSCYDFQAAMTHEIGHVLGLGHPDVASTGGMNLEVNRTAGQLLALEITGKVAQTYGQGLRPGHLLESLSAAEVQELEACGGLESCFLQAEVDCWDPWPHTTVKPSKSETEADYAPTIMAAFTFNNPSSCIFQDDLDAINVLYPACSGTQTFPICTQPTTYVGYIRLVLYVGVPLVICLAAMILFNKFAVAMQLRAQDRSRARMRSELRQVPEEVLSRKERKIRQWEAEIKLLRVKRKRMLDAGLKQHAPRMEENSKAIEDRVLKINHANTPAFEEEEDESSDEDFALLRRFRKKRPAPRITRSKTDPEGRGSPAAALSGESALALSTFSTRRVAPTLETGASSGSLDSSQTQPARSSFLEQQDSQEHLKVGAGGQAAPLAPLARPALHPTSSFTQGPPLPPLRPVHSSSREPTQHF